MKAHLLNPDVPALSLLTQHDDLITGCQLSHSYMLLTYFPETAGHSSLCNLNKATPELEIKGEASYTAVEQMLSAVHS